MLAITAALAIVWCFSPQVHYAPVLAGRVLVIRSLNPTGHERRSGPAGCGGGLSLKGHPTDHSGDPFTCPLPPTPPVRTTVHGPPVTKPYRSHPFHANRPGASRGSGPIDTLVGGGEGSSPPIPPGHGSPLNGTIDPPSPPSSPGSSSTPGPGPRRGAAGGETFGQQISAKAG